MDGPMIINILDSDNKIAELWEPLANAQIFWTLESMKDLICTNKMMCQEERKFIMHAHLFMHSFWDARVGRKRISISNQ